MTNESTSVLVPLASFNIFSNEESLFKKVDRQALGESLSQEIVCNPKAEQAKGR